MSECSEVYVPCVQVPILVKGKDVMVALKDRTFLEIQVSLGARDSRRVEGLLRKPVKSFGNGSTWELISEGSCKAGTPPMPPGKQHSCMKRLCTESDKECAQL